MNKIHFSVITVVRNDLQGLKKTRASLEKQKYKNWTHIIIDGHSIDGTRNYLKTLNLKKTIFLSEPDSGIYDAMNKGWGMADSESYSYFLNARDVFVDNDSLIYAANALECADRPNWGCTTHEEIEANGEGWVCKLVSPPTIQNQLYAFGYRSHQAVLMKTSFIEELGGFNELYRIAADWDLIARALNHSQPTTWEHSLGRFELGGTSSQNLLLAHLELRQIRAKYLLHTKKIRLIDNVWCAIYLRSFGYKNFLTPFINKIYSAKLKPTKKNKRRRKLQFFPLKRIMGKLGVEVSISVRPPRFLMWSYFRKVKYKQLNSFMYWLLRFIQNRLSLQGYETPNFLNHPTSEFQYRDSVKLVTMGGQETD